MSKQAHTYYDQARRFLRAGDLPRAGDLLRRAKLLAEGDAELTLLILRELVIIGPQIGWTEEARHWLDQLVALERPTRAAAPMPDRAAYRPPERGHSRVLLGVSSLLALAAVAAAAVWFGRPANPAPLVPSPARDSVAAPGARDVVSSDLKAPKPSKPVEISARERRLNENVGLLLWVQRYQGLVNGKTQIWDRLLGNGTGFAVSKAGIMLTNQHVTAAMRKIKIPDTLELTDTIKLLKVGKPVLKVCFGADPSMHYDADVLHESPSYDMAIIRVDKQFETPFRFLERPVAPDDPVVAVGFPGVVLDISSEGNLDRVKTLLESISQGQCSYFKQYPPDAFKFVATSGTIISPNRSLNEMLFHMFDAKISGGNSGGPLLLKGTDEVVGIVTLAGSTLESSGYNYALALSQFREELERYLR